MANLKPEIGQLFIQNQENDRSTVGMYISEPTPLEEKNLGNVYAVVEIGSAKPENQEIIDIISQSLASAYYQSPDFDAEIAFESALKGLNQKLQQISSEVGEEWVGTLNAVVAVNKGAELHFAQIGNVHAFLVQDEKIMEIGGVTREKANPLKIFSNIMSGNLTAKSTVVFCTESILDYISQEKLRKTVAGNSVKDAGQYLQNLLNENSNQNNFAAIVLRLKEEAASRAGAAAPARGEAAASSGDDSMESLVGREKATSEILAPSLWPGLKKNLRKIKKGPEPSPSADLRQEEAPAPESPERAMTGPTQKRTRSLEAFQKTGQVLKKAGSGLARGARGAAAKARDMTKKKDAYPRKMKSIPRQATGWFGRTVAWFKQLSLARKVLLGVIVVLVFVLAQGLIRAELKSEGAAGDSTQYEETIAQINEKLNEVDNFMLMNNEEGARKLLVECSQMLGTIPTDSKVYKQEGGATAAKIQEGLDKVFRVNRIGDPETAVDYGSVSPDATIGSLERIGDTIYAFSADGDAVYQGTLEKNEASEVVPASGDAAFAAVAKDSAATALAWTAANELLQFNPVLEKLSEVGLGSVPDGFKANDIKVFGSRLYALGDGGQILKFSSSGDNYGDGSEWIENGKLENPRSMAIDGAIYVIDGNGGVKKFFSGSLEKDFGLSELEPKVESPTVIYTDENITSIYLLDPPNRRALRYNKEGKLTSQYTSDKFDNLVDLVVDEDTGTLYLLNGSTVYKVGI